jgi:hypothetical protein
VTVVKVTRRERAAAKLIVELDRIEGRETDPRIEAMANAKRLMTANGEPVAVRDAEPAEFVAVGDAFRLAEPSSTS